MAPFSALQVANSGYITERMELAIRKSSVLGFYSTSHPEFATC